MRGINNRFDSDSKFFYKFSCSFFFLIFYYIHFYYIYTMKFSTQFLISSIWLNFVTDFFRYTLKCHFDQVIFFLDYRKDLFSHKWANHLESGVQTISSSYVQVAIIIKLTFSYGGLYAHPRRSVCMHCGCLARLHKGWVLCRVSYWLHTQ